MSEVGLLHHQHQARAGLLRADVGRTGGQPAAKPAGETLDWMARAKTYGEFDAVVTERTVLNGIDLSLGRLRSRLAAGAPDIGAEESGTGLVLLVK